MVEDQSSRWRAAASPGGLIGLVLVILVLMATAAAGFGLFGIADFPVPDMVLWASLGVGAILIVALLFLIWGYLSIGYVLDAQQLLIRWGPVTHTIPISEIEFIGPASEVLADQTSSWQPIWPGYYVGTRSTSEGQVQVVATSPVRRQVLIELVDGRLFAVSPERPLLFMEEVARWHRVGQQTPVEQPPRVLEEPAPASHEPERPREPESVFGAPVVSPSVTAPDREDPAASLPSPERYQSGLEPEEPSSTSMGTHSEPEPLVGEDPAIRTPDQPLSHGYVERTPVPDAEVDSEPWVEPGPHSGDRPRPDAVLHPEVLASVRTSEAIESPFSSQEQGASRVYRARPSATSPLLRPILLRDPVALSLIGAGFVATAAMALYILIQFDDIPPSLTLHWNVDGLPGRIGEPREIWILPVITVLVLLANIGLAWSIALFDRFAARLILGSTIVVHLVTWVALIMILR